MVKLVLILSTIVAITGCRTASLSGSQASERLEAPSSGETQVVAASSSEVQELRTEVLRLRKELQEVRSAQNREALRRFHQGRRVKKPTDKRKDMPKGAVR